MSAGYWSRVGGIFFSPSQTLRSIAERPTWVAPLIVLLLVTIAFTAVAMPILDQEASVRRRVEQRLEEQGQEIDEERIEQAVEMADRFKWVGGVFAIVISVASYFFLALIFMVAFRLLGGGFGYKASLAVTTHGLLPLALAGLLMIPIVVMRDAVTPEELQAGLIASNPAFFLDQDASPVLRALLSSLDIFKIWSAVLLGIGFAIAGRLKRSTGLVTVFVLWGIWIVCRMGLAAIFS